MQNKSCQIDMLSSKPKYVLCTENLNLGKELCFHLVICQAFVLKNIFNHTIPTSRLWKPGGKPPRPYGDRLSSRVIYGSSVTRRLITEVPEARHDA